MWRNLFTPIYSAREQAKKNGSCVDRLILGGTYFRNSTVYQWTDGHLDKNDCNKNINKVAKYVEVTNINKVWRDDSHDKELLLEQVNNEGAGEPMFCEYD